MTNEQIDKLKGRRLDVAFAKALNVHSTWRYHENLDDAIAVLPAEWGWRAGTCIDVDAKYFATVWPHEVGIAEFEQCEASNPATALCRAALKAKLAAAEPAKRGDPCACGPEHKPDCWNAEPAGESPDGWKCPQCEVVNSRRFAMCVRCSAERVNACGQTWAEFCAELDGKPAADSPPLHESQTTDDATAAEPAGDGQDQGHR